MQIRNNHGDVVGEISSSITQNGERIITNTLYDRGNPVIQNISVRDDEGRVHTATVIGGKVLP